MPSRPKGQELTLDEWVTKLALLRPEVRLPGFWKGLADNGVRWAEELTVGPFWTEAKNRLGRWRMEYRKETGADLLTQPGLPSFVSKSEQSIRDKLFRRCRSDQTYLDKAFERQGPPIPHLGDLVRTRIACRYIDGVEFLTTKLFDLAKELGLSPSRRREGRIEGYFAQHLTLHQEVIYRMGGGSQLARIVCEVQAATEMATHMWVAAHPLYEHVRGDENEPQEWQWKPSDPRFISNQLGHMIHLADGLLVQLRQSPKRKV